ncbi:TonB-dependent receptor [Xanthomonas protegens]|uniref:TonB-dependent receptor n=1 Tax=Xanthomonas protegens TaxID=3380705 RepID=A0ABU9L9Y9_9XANT
MHATSSRLRAAALPISAPHRLRHACAPSLLSAALVACLAASTAHAADEAASNNADTTPTTLSALDVVASSHAAAVAPTQVVGPNRYVINAGDMDADIAGSNGLARLKTVPGASYTATDGLGLDVSATSLFVRGFRMNEMGVTFEGVPLNDSGFLSLTGTSVVNVGVPDAIGTITVSPGAAPVSVFSSSANGGALEYRLGEPKETPGLRIKQGMGSNATRVTTVSAQSGQLGDNGPKVQVDLQRLGADKYQGGGTQRFLRGDLKATQDVAWGTFTVFLSASHAAMWGYNNLSFDMLGKLGWRADSLYPDYARAYAIALPQNAAASCGAYRCGALAGLLPYDTGQVTDDRIASLAHDFHISDALSGHVQLYSARSRTHATLSDPTTPSPDGAPFSEQVQAPHLRRTGGLLSLTYVHGRHTLSAGVWQEHGSADAATSWYTEPLLGQGQPLRTTGPWDVYGPAFKTDNLSQWTTRARQAYLHDDIALSDTLVLGVGAKAVDFRTSGGGVGDAPDRPASGTLRARSAFLPHLSLFWSPTAQTDGFIDLGSAMNGFRVAQRGNIGYTASAWTVPDQATFDRLTRRLRPEQDWNLTVGGTHRFDRATVTADVFYGDIRNRLLSAAVGTQFAQVNTVQVMPRMHTFGADLGVTVDLTPHVQFYQGVALARSVYDRDVVVDGSVYPIQGKAQPGYPQLSLVSDLSAHVRHWRLGATSTEYLHQPFTYENDLRVPAFWQVNAYTAYTLGADSRLPGLELRLDVSNLLDRHNIGTANIAGSAFAGDYQTLQRSAPRQLLFSTSLAF